MLFFAFCITFFLFMLGHLSLPYVLQFIQPAICFISKLPKVSLMALFGYYVWVTCISDRKKSILYNAGTLCLSWDTLVREKLFVEGLSFHDEFQVPLLFDESKYIINTSDNVLVYYKGSFENFLHFVPVSQTRFSNYCTSPFTEKPWAPKA